jgi:hypothetical protein
MTALLSPSLPSADLPLHLLVTPTAVGPNQFSFVFPDGWQQGRGAFGGLVAAAMVRAIEAAAGDPTRTLRSLTLELCGPTQPGPLEVQTEVLRAGTGMTTMAARLVQAVDTPESSAVRELQAHAVAVLGRDRSADLDRLELRPPQLPPWREVPVLELGPPLAPLFTRYFEFRNAGHVPFSGATDAVAQGWIRPRFGPQRPDAAWIAACADAWWPILFSRASRPRPMATVAYTLQILADPAALNPDAPLAYRARTATISRGHAIEFRELWSEDGQLVALNQQTIAIIK